MAAEGGNVANSVETPFDGTDDSADVATPETSQGADVVDGEGQPVQSEPDPVGGASDEVPSEPMANSDGSAGDTVDAGGEEQGGHVDASALPADAMVYDEKAPDGVIDPYVNAGYVDVSPAVVAVGDTESSDAPEIHEETLGGPQPEEESPEAEVAPPPPRMC